MNHYVDHNAATPMLKTAIDVMSDIQLRHFANPSSVHSPGYGARNMLTGARLGIAELIGCEEREVYFTSGGTESNNWAISGILKNRPGWALITSSVEHKSILKVVEEATWKHVILELPVNHDGVIYLESLPRALVDLKARPTGGKNCLVSVMLANNETGVIQPVREVVDIVKKYCPLSLVHTDAVQAFGKMPVNVGDLGVDLMTISSHKVGGPKGVGALYVRKGVDIAPMILGGHQEGDRRAGTENVAGAAAFYAAAKERHGKTWEYWDAVSHHVAQLLEALEVLDGTHINGGDAERLPNTVNIRFDGVDSDALVLLLSGSGIHVSNGSACEAGSLEGSHVLKAMGQDEVESTSAIRFSFSDDLDPGAVTEIADAVISAVKSLREQGLAGLPF